ncbi:metal-dependent hydrolase [Magnetococcus sp. PR-3]|uniref:metal-dependent hydrolase n=1 Tax=Magnetococcus sp. PR-3 TaxID=3120355 RepID=UPI002FCE0E26
MDSITQMALGAAVGSALLGRKVGARAALWGAVCGTIPDLDVFIPMGDAVAAFTYHRSFSHSLFILAAITPLVVWLILKIHPQTQKLRTRWAVFVYAVFATHVLLDCLTIYGTQIFWPLSEYPVSLGSVFIIDPAYTVPLLIGVFVALALRHRDKGRWVNRLGLVVSTLYLVWGLGAQAYVRDLARESLKQQGVDYERFLVQPTPFNSLLWRVVVMSGERYHVGYYSLLDKTPSIHLESYERSLDLLDSLTDHWPVQRLAWFTHGFYAVDAEKDGVVIADLRMGVEPDYVFRFKVAALANPHPEPITAVRMPRSQNFNRLPALWHRVWQDPSEQRHTGKEY